MSKPNGLNNGEWINIGHVCKMFSNPNSETYKCNFCGHELYTLYGFPPLPEYCPKFGQRMSNGNDLKELFKT